MRSTQISASHEEQLSPWSILVLFETWGDARIGLIELASDNVYLKTCSARLSQSTGCLISSLHCELLSGTVSTAAAHDLILAEVDGKCQFGTIHLRNGFSSLISQPRDLPGGPVVKTLLSNAGGLWVPSLIGEDPTCLSPKSQNRNQKQYCNRFNKH